MKLIIAEKPSVAIAIAKALGIIGKKDGYIENDKYIISWCIGHLVSAAFPEEYDAKYSKWNYADLPIIPDTFKYKIYGDKQKQFKVIKSLMHRKDVTEIVSACDAGREGELIFRLVYNMAECKRLRLQCCAKGTKKYHTSEKKNFLRSNLRSTALKQKRIKSKMKTRQRKL